MDNTEQIVQVDNIDSLVSDQPNDLLSYIGSQQFQAAPDGLTVNQDGSVAPQDEAAAAGQQNVAQAAAQVAPPAAAPSVPDPGLTNPPPGMDAAEKQRYERAIADLQSQVGSERQTALRIAQAARQREDQLFEQSLQGMDQESADLARAKHDAQRAREAADFFKGQYQEVTQRQQTQEQERQAREQETLKQLGAIKLAQHLNFPMDYVQDLMQAETPNGMLAMAKRLYERMGPAQAQQLVQHLPVQQVSPAVLAAGGEQVPPAPTQRVEKHKGDLIGMMRERPYQSVVVG